MPSERAVLLSSKSKHSDKAFRNTILQVELIHTESLLFNFFCHFWSDEFTTYSINRQAATSKPCNS